MVAELGERRIDVRDRAILLMGFAGAFGRSELVALDVEDITDTDDGLRIAVRRSKADQEGAGDLVGLPYGSNPATCPVRAWRAWLEVSAITAGAAFRAITRHDKAARRRLSSHRRRAQDRLIRVIDEVQPPAWCPSRLLVARPKQHSQRSCIRGARSGRPRSSRYSAPEPLSS
jgi:integrase